MSGARPLPTLRATATGMQLIVDGRPALLLGGQLHNSSPSSPEYMQPIWDRLADAGIRTVIGAASWAQVEPVEGTFDFSTVDAQIEQAQARGMRLVLIWFGAFKNAASTYAPAWVRRDGGRFARAVAAGADKATRYTRQSASSSRSSDGTSSGPTSARHWTIDATAPRIRLTASSTRSTPRTSASAVR